MVNDKTHALAKLASSLAAASINTVFLPLIIKDLHVFCAVFQKKINFRGSEMQRLGVFKPHSVQ
jgi:hypothetical protein